MLAAYESLVEVGVGERAELAGELAERGCRVVATDVVEREVPAGVEFVVDDVTDPDLSVYRGADAVYARRVPPELQRSVLAVAREVDAACLFTTLGGDPVVVDARPVTVAEGTVYVARE
ncbi:hypothetical protein GCM10009039_28800 [Halocalculus aciditolerans]|uniref:UPF0146 protein GCM10009039_28800 n=1 Tax=Halocalculus aciditolerans TaxID=1383812 RepID=A0A830FF10_9EURY|nr:hypothetical protein GCM10009039_28800 [Halocalculus aciditolerans]